MNDGVARVSRREKHAQVRLQAAGLLRELPAVHAVRQSHVGEEQINVPELAKRL